MSVSSFSNLAKAYMSGEMFRNDPAWSKVVDSNDSNSSEARVSPIGKQKILLYEPKHSIRIYRSSFVLLFSAIFCLVYFSPYCYDLTLLSTLVGLTSINYWKHPIFGIRRTIDIIAVQSGLFYHLYCWYYELDYNQNDNYRWIYLIGFLGTILPLYTLAIYNGLNRNFYTASWCHAGMQMGAVVWNIFLYSCLFSLRSNMIVLDTKV